MCECLLISHFSLNEITPYTRLSTCYHDYDYVFLERIIFVINLHWATLNARSKGKNKEIIKNRQHSLTTLHRRAARLWIYKLRRRHCLAKHVYLYDYRNETRFISVAARTIRILIKILCEFCWPAFAHEANETKRKKNGSCAWNERAAGSKVNFDKFNFNAYTSICAATQVFHVRCEPERRGNKIII